MIINFTNVCCCDGWMKGVQNYKVLSLYAFPVYTNIFVTSGDVDCEMGLCAFIYMCFCALKLIVYLWSIFLVEFGFDGSYITATTSRRLAVSLRFFFCYISKSADKRKGNSNVCTDICHNIRPPTPSTSSVVLFIWVDASNARMMMVKKLNSKMQLFARPLKGSCVCADYSPHILQFQSSIER